MTLGHIQVILCLAAAAAAAYVDNTFGLLGFGAAAIASVMALRMGTAYVASITRINLLLAFYNAHNGKLPPGIPKESIEKFEELMEKVK